MSTSEWLRTMAVALLTSTRHVRTGLVVLAICWCASCAKACAATHAAASCSRDDISKAIDAASSGDIVMVPAGAATWTNNLVIPKGVTLQGAGADKTIITSAYAPSRVGNTLAEGNSLIVYKPVAPEKNEPFRLTGFTLDLTGTCSGIMLKNGAPAIIDRIRIDHKTIKNAAHPDASKRAIMVRGNTAFTRPTQTQRWANIVSMPQARLIESATRGSGFGRRRRDEGRKCVLAGSRVWQRGDLARCIGLRARRGPRVRVRSGAAGQHHEDGQQHNTQYKSFHSSAFTIKIGIVEGRDAKFVTPLGSYR